MTKLLYLQDSYQKTHTAKIMHFQKRGTHFEIVLNETIFYPQGGGQLSDKGIIQNKHGTFSVTHVRMQDKTVIHEGKLTGKLSKGDIINCSLDWALRWQNMQLHSGGHVIHEIVMQLIHDIKPIKANHGKNAFIEYQGIINPKLKDTIEKQSNMAVVEGRKIAAEMVSFEEIVKRNIKVYGNLPKNKPLRLITIDGFSPIPDGGTQVANTSEIGLIKIIDIEVNNQISRIYYTVVIPPIDKSIDVPNPKKVEITNMDINSFKTLIIDMEKEINNAIKLTSNENLEQLQVKYFGSNGKATQLIRKIKLLPLESRKSAGIIVNQFKQQVLHSIKSKQNITREDHDWFDITVPGILLPDGHLHIVTQAITEITQIFSRIGFGRVRYPEVEWDWYAFGSLNMPKSHPARDEWETFHIQLPMTNDKLPMNSKFNKIVLTPHTSNGQVREMEKKQLPIKMINISKCYRRQIDISHTPMFHQFEGMYIDKNVSIGHLKGFIDYFIKQYFGINRKFRLRPFHFQFTEPSFEVDISCDICNGLGCRLCKEGWLELAGSGMIHPNVLKSGNIDPNEYSGFAIGWGVERTYMMKSGTKLDDIRLIYGNDLRFLEQF